MEDIKGRNGVALKSGIWYTVSSISVKTISIITTPLFTRLMTTEDYGISATFTSWFTLLNVVCSLNLWYSVGRAKIDFPKKLNEFIGSMQLLALLFTLALESCAILFIDQVSDILELDQPLVIALFVYLLAYPAVQLTQAKFKYLYNYKGNIAITVYTTVVTACLSVVFILNMPNHMALGKVLGAVVSTGILAVVIWFIILRDKYVKIDLTYWKYALKISVPLILNSISLNILAQSDRLFITKFNGAHYTAIYSLAYSYAILINIILNAINEAWLPWFHDTLNDGMIRDIRNNVKPLVGLGCWIGVGCIAIAPEAIAILGGNSYKDGIWAVPPVTVGVVCSYVFQHYEHIELHLKKTWYISAGTVITAVINIALNYIFVPIYGFVAAAYTTLFCFFLLMFAHHAITHFIMKMDIYDNAFMYKALIITVILAAVFMVLYNYLWIWRWILIVIISAFYLVYNRKMICAAMSHFKRKK